MSENPSVELVVDFGTATTKAGFGGQQSPTIFFDSLIGRPRYKRLIGLAPSEEIIGPEPRLRPLFTLRSAVARGVPLPEAADGLWSRVWADVPKTTVVSRVFVTEPPFTSLSAKHAVAENLIKSRGVNGIFFGTQAVLSLFGYGRTDGLLFEAGEGIAQLAPVYNGYKLTHVIERSCFAGGDLTRWFGELMCQNGTLVGFSADRWLLDRVKCALSEARPRGHVSDSSSTATFELPDGSTLAIGTEASDMAEALFTPQLAGSSALPYHELIAQAIAKLDVDLRGYMLRHIHLSGGTTMIRGFPERLGQELSVCAPPNAQLNIIAPAVDKRLLAWQGASIVTQLSSFANMWVTAADFAESGERALLTKAL